MFIDKKKPSSFINEFKQKILKNRKKINIELVSTKKLEKLFDISSHQGIAAMIEPYKILNI